MAYMQGDIAALVELLDAAFTQVRDGAVFEGMEGLLTGLGVVRRSSEPDEWRQICELYVRSHPLFALVHKAPFTRRAFTKPRGYPGDAVTLDYIYGLEPLDRLTTSTVRTFYAWEFQTPSCRSVRARKALLGHHIDLAGQRSPRPRILSLACGHLREARDSLVVLDRLAGAFFAVDQDAESLSVVDAELAPYGVETVRGSVRGVLASKVAYADLDLAYAAGLYDYVPDPVAIQLTAKLFAMLGTGGRLLVPNFNTTLRDIGYLEAFMDWWLLYRDDAAMLRLLAAIPAGELADAQLFRDQHGSITFLEVTRR